MCGRGTLAPRRPSAPTLPPPPPPRPRSAAVAEAGLAHGQRLALAQHPRLGDLADEDGVVARQHLADDAALEVAERVVEDRAAVPAGVGGDLLDLARVALVGTPEVAGQLALPAGVDVDGEDAAGPDEADRVAVVLDRDHHRGRLEGGLDQPVGGEAVALRAVRDGDGVEAVGEHAQDGLLGGGIHRWLLLVCSPDSAASRTAL